MVPTNNEVNHNTVETKQARRVGGTHLAKAGIGEADADLRDAHGDGAHATEAADPAHETDGGEGVAVAGLRVVDGDEGVVLVTRISQFWID